MMLLNRKHGSWSSRATGWIVLAGISLASLLATSPRLAMAQDKEQAAPPPLVVINAAGVDRLLGDVNYMFKTIGREDLSDVVNGFLGNVGDLKGLDRKKSLGVMLYFKQGFPPGVDPVGYVPVDNIKDLLDTLELGPVTTKKVPGEENRYEIEGRRQTLHVALQGGYAYVSNNVNVLDRELPDPGPLTQSLSQRYDLAVSLSIEGVPEGMRTLFLDFLRAQTEADLQQRDNEPAAAYRARKAAGINNLKNIEAIIQDGHSITLGVDASQETKSIVVELEVKAKPRSSFAKQLNQFPGKPTVFGNAYSEHIPMAATGSWSLSADDKKTYGEFVKALELGVTDRLKNQNLDPSPLAGIIKSLESTVNTGSIDFFLQFIGEPPGKFSLVGGMKVDHSGDFASGLQGLMQQLTDLPGIAEMVLNAEKHNGVGLHRLMGKGDGGSAEQRLYGGRPALYIGAGRGAVWFALGKDGAAEQLKQAMTLVETIPAEPLTPDKIAPFQMVLNLSSWVGLNPEARGRFGEAAREAFKPNNDRMLITARPTQDGFRLKLQFDEGFIKFLGLRASDRLDRSQL